MSAAQPTNERVELCLGAPGSKGSAKNSHGPTLAVDLPGPATVASVLDFVCHNGFEAFHGRQLRYDYFACQAAKASVRVPRLCVALVDPDTGAQVYPPTDSDHPEAHHKAAQRTVAACLGVTARNRHLRTKPLQLKVMRRAHVYGFEKNVAEAQRIRNKSVELLFNKQISEYEECRVFFFQDCSEEELNRVVQESDPHATARLDRRMAGSLLQRLIKCHCLTAALALVEGEQVRFRKMNYVVPSQVVGAEQGKPKSSAGTACGGESALGCACKVPFLPKKRAIKLMRDLEAFEKDGNNGREDFGKLIQALKKEFNLEVAAPVFSHGFKKGPMAATAAVAGAGAPDDVRGSSPVKGYVDEATMPNFPMQLLPATGLDGGVGTKWGFRTRDHVGAFAGGSDHGNTGANPDTAAAQQQRADLLEIKNVLKLVRANVGQLTAVDPRDGRALREKLALAILHRHDFSQKNQLEPCHIWPNPPLKPGITQVGSTHALIANQQRQKRINKEQSAKLNELHRSNVFLSQDSLHATDTSVNSLGQGAQSNGNPGQGGIGGSKPGALANNRTMSENSTSHLRAANRGNTGVTKSQYLDLDPSHPDYKYHYLNAVPGKQDFLVSCVNDGANSALDMAILANLPAVALKLIDSPEFTEINNRSADGYTSLMHALQMHLADVSFAILNRPDFSAVAERNACRIECTAMQMAQKRAQDGFWRGQGGVNGGSDDSSAKRGNGLRGSFDRNFCQGTAAIEGQAHRGHLCRAFGHIADTIARHPLFVVDDRNSFVRP